MKTSATDAAGANTTLHAIAVRAYGQCAAYTTLGVVSLSSHPFVFHTFLLFQAFVIHTRSQKKPKQKKFFSFFLFSFFHFSRK